MLAVLGGVRGACLLLARNFSRGAPPKAIYVFRPIA